MKKILFGSLIYFMSIFVAKADEGMWIPALLEKFNEQEMIKMGMRITAKDIYDINHSSIKDAIVSIGGCSAQLISDQGLLITNHHCGFGRIQRHSSLEHDYLTDGFWAMDKSEELANEGMTAKFLIRIDEVTDEVLKNVSDTMTEVQRAKVIRDQIKEIKKKAEKETGYDASISAFYYGNQYFMYITETYKDVRLVGAPPSNIGKFGGDTDNWMWPRHTGDFSIFRIYADKNNKPAKYSKDNVPYKPKYHLRISLKGANKGDFTFVFGYPGRTEEYLPSYGVDMQTNIIHPVSIKIRTELLDIFKKYVEKDKLVRIQYAAKTARVANGWKKWIGAKKGIRRLGAINKKKAFEKEFVQWTNSSPETKSKYGHLIADFEETYKELAPFKKASTLLRETIMGIEIINFSTEFKRLIELKNDSVFKVLVSRKQNSVKRFFKDYHQPIGKETFEKLLTIYQEDSESEYLPEFFTTINSKYKGDFKKFADHIFKKSIFASENKLSNMLSEAKLGKLKALKKDPLFKLTNQLIILDNTKLIPSIKKLEDKLKKMQRLYMKAQMEMQPEKRFYPDANGTIRVTYGNVKGFNPSDGVTYKHFTTMEGILEKEDPNIYDYVVEDKLKELYNNKDFGQYADKDGSLHVCFIAANHTSGGNSGSPILNADGHLLGLNFDRNWEGTMSDLMYDPDYCRNISVDIRYCLFVIDKFAGATHLVDEMTIIK